MQPKPTTLEGAFQRLSELLDHNQQAVQFLRDLHHISHTWDDLIDGDKLVEPERIHRAFTAATVGLALNPFFQRHAAMLAPVMLNGILLWRAANDMEAARDHLEVAHVIRCAAGDVALICAAVIHGHEKAAAMAAELRILMQQESLPEYLAQHQGATK